MVKVDDTFEFSSPNGKTKVWIDKDEGATVTYLWLYTEEKSVVRNILADAEIAGEIKPTISSYHRPDEDKPFAWQMRLEKRHWSRVSKLDGIPELPRRAFARVETTTEKADDQKTVKAARTPAQSKSAVKKVAVRKPSTTAAKSRTSGGKQPKTESKSVIKARKLTEKDAGLSRAQKSAIAKISSVLAKEDSRKTSSAIKEKSNKVGKKPVKSAPSPKASPAKKESGADMDTAIKAIVAKGKARHADSADKPRSVKSGAVNTLKLSAVTTSTSSKAESRRLAGSVKAKSVVKTQLASEKTERKAPAGKNAVKAKPAVKTTPAAKTATSVVKSKTRSDGRKTSVQ